MSALAELEVALRRDRALDRLAAAYSHRAVREDSLGVVRGRDAILAAWLAEEPADFAVEADLGEMIAYRVADAWSGHRWVWREDGRIVREVVVEDRGEARAAPALHPPLGELRSGEGQFAAAAQPHLPPGFPETARDVATLLHRRWNGRALGRDAEGWLLDLLRLAPDGAFQFEHAAADGDTTALLWRFMGHHASGRRLRLIGSTVVAGGAAASVMDRAAIAAQLAAETISYA